MSNGASNPFFWNPSRYSTPISTKRNPEGSLSKIPETGSDEKNYLKDEPSKKVKSNAGIGISAPHLTNTSGNRYSNNNSIKDNDGK